VRTVAKEGSLPKSRADEFSLQAKYFHAEEVEEMGRKGELEAMDLLELMQRDANGPVIGMSSR